MGGVVDILLSSGPMLPLALLLLAAGGGVLAWPAFAGGAKEDVKRRLHAGMPAAAAPTRQEAPQKSNRKKMREQAARTAQEFYAKSDPASVAKLRMKLIQAGYMDPGAVGRFFLIRFVGLILAGIAGIFVVNMIAADETAATRWMYVGAIAVLGYFAPGFVLSRRIAAKMQEYRNGFPDFMDLMIVCSDAGMSMEAGIERVAREIQATYPSLGQNLQLVSIELRAGRSMDDALKSLADRLNLDEVRSFATLLQQSKELGTSLSGALRVFSDDMRHKRMSLAEEKAHALPAKMSVPVTVCILPVVMMIAIIPVIVKYTTQ